VRRRAQVPPERVRRREGVVGIHRCAWVSLSRPLLFRVLRSLHSGYCCVRRTARRAHPVPLGRAVLFQRAMLRCENDLSCRKLRLLPWRLDSLDSTQPLLRAGAQTEDTVSL
jgi:hypothetical protein